MATKTPRIDNLEALSGNQIQLQYIDAPHTQVVNRAQVVDPTQDGLPKFGVERFRISDVIQLKQEHGPTGQAVWTSPNDLWNRLRIYAHDTSELLDNAANGPAIILGEIGASLEFTFLGTGFNVLVSYTDASERGFDVYVDGVFDSTVSIIANSGISNDITNRNHSSNRIIPVASGLSQGIHTVRIQKTTSVNTLISGIEVVNDASSIYMPAMTRSNGVQYSQTVLQYASGFESGTLGTKGGRVSIYAKADGTYGHAVNPTKASIGYINSVHTGEEIISEHAWREFGVGRGDDFSQIHTTNQRTLFTLEDGTTTLMCDDADSDFNTTQGIDRMFSTTSSTQPIVFEFIGTGLDIIFNSLSGTFSSVIVDGVNAGSLTINSGEAQRKVSICSGLPYGSHRVSLVPNGSGASAGVCKFFVYVPSKPSLPEGAIELASYNIMADFSVNTTTSDANFISEGILRKAAVRESIYRDTFNRWEYIENAGLFPTGLYALNRNAISDATGNDAEIQFSFFGSGFEWKFISGTASHTSLDVTVDGVPLNTNNFPSAVATGYGVDTQPNIAGAISSGQFNAYSSTTEYNASITVTGLSLGYHTITIAGQDVGNSLRRMQVYCFDVITPVHTHKVDGPYIKQGTMRSGSECIADERKLTRYKNISVAKAIQDTSTTASVSVIGDCVLPIKVDKTSRVQIDLSPSIYDTTNGPDVDLEMKFELFVDYNKIDEFLVQAPWDDSDDNKGFTRTTVLPKGEYLIYVRASDNAAGGGTQLVRGFHIEAKVLD